MFFLPDWRHPAFHFICMDHQGWQAISLPPSFLPPSSHVLLLGKSSRRQDLPFICPPPLLYSALPQDPALAFFDGQISAFSSAQFVRVQSRIFHPPPFHSLRDFCPVPPCCFKQFTLPLTWRLIPLVLCLPRFAPLKLFRMPHIQTPVF